MLRVHYYRYDQDYTGWDLWIWEKGKEGLPYMFIGQENLHGDKTKIAKVAEIDVSLFANHEIGIIVRRGGWHERDVNLDRYFHIEKTGKDEWMDIYVVQDTVELFMSEDHLSLTPGMDTAVFENFREIFVRLQAPAKISHDKEPFAVFEDGHQIPIRHVTPIRGWREILISLEHDMIPGSTYSVYKPGFREAYVSYGMIFDTPEFEKKFTYEESDLGASWSAAATHFRLWAPIASKVFLNLYSSGTGSTLLSVQEMKRDEKGTWITRVDGDLSGKYYTYSVAAMGKTHEAADPYGRSSGVNGARSMIIDLSRTNPEGWEHIHHVYLENPTDAIIYEAHVRDATIHENSGVKFRGKYLGLSEWGTHSPDGNLTGLSHFKELGVTHVHFLPIFDFFSVDETRLQENAYNWGYDPVHYNVPDGSYSTNPYDGWVRVRELKQMIKAIKETGIGIVMDVVYNHTYQTNDSDFNKIVPGYYYRTDRLGRCSNGSGCGNETASERSMVRKFIIDSVKYWSQEYKIDGFRFDLMGLHDIETMNSIRVELDFISPSTLLYGEGWTGGPSLLDSSNAATKTNAPKLAKIGFFNDNSRDGIKGDNFHSQETGFITGNCRSRESVKFGVVGAVYHPGVNYPLVNYSGFAWAGYAWHCVNYVASHDNLTLYDKLIASRSDLEEKDIMKLCMLAGAIVLASQGIPFFMLGTDFMRTKQGEHNSYRSPDAINQIDWKLKSKFNPLFEYYKGLIALRKAHPAFRMVLSEEIRRNLRFLNTSECAIAYMLENYANEDTWKNILVVFNAGTQPETVDLAVEGTWQVVVEGQQAGNAILSTFSGTSVSVPPRSALIAFNQTL